MLDPSPSRPPHAPWAAPGAVDHWAGDMMATASADVTLGALRRHLATRDQWLPIDGRSDATLGDLVATNSTGPLRLGYGAWRDLLLSVQFLDGNGQLITVGGRTVKNVAGYDVTKFMVGQRGIFGTPVTITARTYRRPARALLATFPPDQSIINQLMPTPARPQWAVLTEDHLYCGYLGDEQTAEYYADHLIEHRPNGVVTATVDDDIAHRASLWNPDPDNSFRAAVPPARVPDFVRAAGVKNWSADPAFGVVVGPTTDGSQDDHEHQERIHSAASRVGGSVFFNKPGGRVDHYPTAAQDKLLQALKHAFDPDHRLEPL